MASEWSKEQGTTAAVESSSTSGQPSKRRSSCARFNQLSSSLATTTETLTSTYTPATSVGAALASLPPEQVNPHVHSGIKALKITSFGVLKPRILTISADRFQLFITPGTIKKQQRHFQNVAVAGQIEGAALTVRETLPRIPLISRKGIKGITGNLRDKYVRSIDVADMNYLQVGYVGTKKLELTKFKSSRNTSSNYEQFHTNLNGIVSIIHHGSQTLDVLIPDQTDVNMFVSAIKSIQHTYHAAMSNVGNDELLIRYIWYDIDLNQNGLIDYKEFGKILKRINLYMTTNDVFKVYNKFVTTLETTAGGGGGGTTTATKPSEGITFAQCMTLLDGIRREKIGRGWLQFMGSSVSERIRVSITSLTSSGDEEKKKAKLILSSDNIWTSVFGRDVYAITAEMFLTQFLHKVQHEKDATLDDVQHLFVGLNAMEIVRDSSAEKAATMAAAEAASESRRSTDGIRSPSMDVTDTGNNQSRINRTRFEAYLKSRANDIYDPDAQEFDESTLDRPMSCYWINTSHNTYLTGDQLRSNSSVGMYMEALHRGCKCLELDCWDGDTNDKNVPIPVVYHGHTLTSKIPFKDIIVCVKNYVMANRDTYPIILSLENHCSHPYQKVMAKILRDTLAGMLYVFDAHVKKMKTSKELGPDGTLRFLPSPNKLRGMVVIKGKRPPEPDDAPIEEDDDDDDNDDDDYANERGEKQEKTGNKDDAKKKALPKIVSELACLTLFHGVKYKTFESSLKSPPSHMHSIGESKIGKILSKDPNNANLWRRYNVDHMTRTYPAGTRVESSNYNPILAWAMGCQLVALNFQTNDTPLILNDGRFRQNGGCGYVLKPPRLLMKGREQSAEDEGRGGEKDASMTLKIRVLSGSCLPKPDGAMEGECIDPYVKVTVYDVGMEQASSGDEGDSDSSSSKDGENYMSESKSTTIVQDNGYCPVWNEEEYMEFTVQNIDVAMVKFSVRDSDVGGRNDKIAEAAVPVSCLRKGYRSVQLYDLNGTRTGPFGFATLLVEVDYEVLASF